MEKFCSQSQQEGKVYTNMEMWSEKRHRVLVEGESKRSYSAPLRNMGTDSVSVEKPVFIEYQDCPIKN